MRKKRGRPKKEKKEKEKKKFEDDNELNFLQVRNAMGDRLFNNEKFQIDKNDFTFISKAKGDISSRTKKKRKAKEINLIRRIETKIEDRDKKTFQRLLDQLSAVYSKGGNLNEIIKNQSIMNLSKEQEDFFRELISMKSLNITRINFQSGICKEPFYFCAENQAKTRFINNDFLSLNFLASSLLKDFNAQDNIDIYTYKIFEFVDVKAISLQPFKFNFNMRSYYTEDFDTDFYSDQYYVLSEKDQKTIRDSIAKSKADETFLFNDKKYDIYYVNLSMLDDDDIEDYYCIANSKVYKSGEDVVKKLSEKKTVVFYSDKTLTKGVKEIKETAGYCFYSHLMKPVIFCPNSLYFGDEYVSMDFLYRYKINLNEYMNYCMEKGKIFMIDDIMYWDNINSVVEFFTVFSFVASDKKIKGLSKFSGLYNAYLDLKDYIYMWKVHFDNFKKIVYGFLDSFGARINLNKLTKLSLGCYDYVKDESILKNHEKFPVFIKFLQVFGQGTDLMMNYVYADKSLNIVYGIQSVIESVNSLNPLEIAQKIRGIALFLYTCFYNSNEKPIFRDLRCESSFLGSVFGSETMEALLGKMISTVTNKRNEEEVKEEKKKKTNDEKVRDITKKRLKRVLDGNDKFKNLKNLLYEFIIIHSGDFMNELNKNTGELLKNVNEETAILTSFDENSNKIIENAYNVADKLYQEKVNHAISLNGKEKLSDELVEEIKRNIPANITVEELYKYVNKSGDQGVKKIIAIKEKEKEWDKISKQIVEAVQNLNKNDGTYKYFADIESKIRNQNPQISDSDVMYRATIIPDNNQFTYEKEDAKMIEKIGNEGYDLKNIHNNLLTQARHLIDNNGKPIGYGVFMGDIPVKVAYKSKYFIPGDIFIIDEKSRRLTDLKNKQIYKVAGRENLYIDIEGNEYFENDDLK